MPKAKPTGLITRAETKESKQKRKSAEKALTPVGDLPKMPAALKGNRIASGVYTRLIKDYGSLEAKIISKLDYDILVDYCLMMAEVLELSNTRKQVSERADEAETLDELLAAAGLLLKIDARSDRKRSQLHVLRQSLYLTPRARAGVNPPTKKEEEPEDELERLLNEIDLHG